jgi:hypothetical protein
MSFFCAAACIPRETNGAEGRAAASMKNHRFGYSGDLSDKACRISG